MSIKLLKILTKELLLSENKFFASPDYDYPGNRQIVMFSDTDSYDLSGNTHGKESHACKHLSEFEPAFVEQVMNNAMNLVSTFDEVYIVSKKGVLLSSGEDAKKKLSSKNLLNTLDFINDKNYNKITLNKYEEQLMPYLDELTNKYDEVISYYMTDYEYIDHINDMDLLKQKLNSNKVLKFTGEYQGNLYTYYLQPKNTALVAKRMDGYISTMFKVDKKGYQLDKVAGYFERGVGLLNSSLAEVLGIVNRGILNKNITERRLRSIIRNVIKEDIGKLPDYKEKLNSMVIEYKYCNNGFADEIDCGFTVNGKEIDFESMIFPRSEDILFKLLYAIFPDIEEDLEDQVVEHIKAKLGKEQLNKFYSGLDTASEEADNYKTREFGDEDQWNPYH